MFGSRFDGIRKHLNRIDQHFRGIDWKVGQIVPHPISCDQQSELRATLRLLTPQRAIGFCKVRFGSSADGGYVLLDDIFGITGAISLGIGSNNDWDVALAKRGVPVDQFDGSIDAPPNEHRLLRFERLMVDGPMLNHIAARYPESDRPDLILKVDIEGAEWALFDTLDPQILRRFSQIICEFHELRDLGKKDFRMRATRVFAKFAATHAVIHVHGNNHSQYVSVGNVPIPNAMEISFASRSRYSFAPSDELFPTELDRPNSSISPDHFLGAFRF